ncbi:MAG TPA: AAA family ATPase, partial [Methylobacter sp.]
MEELIGKVNGILYSDRNTGYYVLRLIVPSMDGALVTITGTFPGINISVGLKVTFRGVKWIDHPTHGRQVSAQSCEISREKGRNGVVSYLISCVPSIGPVTAGKLYAAFGDDLFNILETNPEQILECSFLSKAQSKAILDEWHSASYVRSASVFLVDLGLNATQVKSVYTRFGQSTIDTIRADPYRLYDCPGVGFQTADSAARRLGIGRDDARRVRAIIMFSISEASFSDGHVYVTSGHIKESIQKLFRKHGLESFSHGDYLPDSLYYPILQSMKVDGTIIADRDHLYLASNWKHEYEAAICIADMIQQPPLNISDLEVVLDAFESKTKIKLSESQREAICLLKKSRVCAITGYPGTGKTLLISAFVHLFEHLNFHYSLLSPTGIAAKRLSQVTGRTASTIHRALGFSCDGKWEFDRSNPYIADAVIVDETSMVDASTFYHLVSALSSDVILILVGDAAQLPSVGAGHVLKNLIQCPSVPSLSLTKIYRQTGESDIV